MKGRYTLTTLLLCFQACIYQSENKAAQDLSALTELSGLKLPCHAEILHAMNDGSENYQRYVLRTPHPVYLDIKEPIYISPESTLASLEKAFGGGLGIPLGTTAIYEWPSVNGNWRLSTLHTDQAFFMDLEFFGER